MYVCMYIFTHTRQRQRQTLRQDASSAAAASLCRCRSKRVCSLKPMLPLLWRLNRASKIGASASASGLYACRLCRATDLS